MSVMLSSSSLLSRLFVSVLIHAAAMSFIMTSQAAGDGFTPLSAHDALERSAARRLNHPKSFHHFLSTGLLSPKNGIQAGSRSETGAEGPHADKLSTFKHQPPLVQYAQSSSYGPYSQNVRDNGQQQVGTTQTRPSGMMPPSSIFTGRTLLGGQSFERPKEEGQTRRTHTRNPHSSYFVVKRVSLLNKTLSFPQTRKYKSSQDGGFTSDPSNVNEVLSFQPLLFPPPTNEIRSAPPSPTRVRYKGYKDTNDLPMGEAAGFFNPRTPLPTNPLEVRRHPSKEKTLSGPSFFKTVDPMSSRRMQGHKKIILYPSKASTLKDGEGGWVSAPKQSPFGTPWYGRFNPNLEHPNRIDQSNRQSSTEHDPTFYVPPQFPQTSLMQNVVPVLHPSTQTNHAKSPAPQGNSTESTQDYKPGPKRIRGFANPLRQPAKEPSSPKRRTSQVFSLPAIKTRPFLLQKYSFGSGGPSSTTPSKPEQVDGSSFTPGGLNVSNLTTDPTSGPISTESNNWTPKSDMSLDRNPNQAKLRLYKGKFGLEGFGTQPLEGDKALVKSPDVTAPHRSGLKLKSLDFWQPDVIKIIGRYNQTSPSRERQNGDHLKSPSEMKGSVAKNDGKDERTLRKLKIPFSQIASSAHLRSEERLRAAATSPAGADGGKKPVEKPLRTRTSSTARGRPVRLRPNNKTNGSIFINVSRNAPIYRLPKTLGRVRAVTYNDIPGSASFSSVRATGVIVPSPNNTRFSNQTEHGEAKAENKTEVSQAVAETKLDDEVNSIQMPELFLRSDGSKGFNVSEVLSAVERHQDARENLLELDYLQTSTGNIFFKSLKPPSLGKQ